MGMCAELRVFRPPSRTLGLGARSADGALGAASPHPGRCGSHPPGGAECHVGRLSDPTACSGQQAPLVRSGGGRKMTFN